MKNFKIFERIFKAKKKILTFKTEEAHILYKKRHYKRWTEKEIRYVDSYIVDTDKRNRLINLTKLRLTMRYRTISSIRCKVRERCARLSVPYKTYTERKKGGI